MSTDTREALAALMVIAAECAQRKPLRGFEELTEAIHIGHRQFGRAHEKADEDVRMLAVRLRAVFDTLAAALATQPAQPMELEQRLTEIAKTLPPMTIIGWNYGGMCEPDEAIKGYTKRQVLEILAAHLPATQPAAQPSAQGEAVALPQDVLDFLREVATQPKSKPDYWSSCWQCESNQSKAEDLLASAPAAPAQPSAQGEAVACQWCCGTGRFADHACRFCAGKGSGSVLASAPAAPAQADLRAALKSVLDMVARGVPDLATVQAARNVLAAAPAQAVPLSEDRIRHLWDKACRTVTAQGGGNDVLVFAEYLTRELVRAIERAHGIAPKAAQENTNG